MRVLITGGMGFVGSNLIPNLLNDSDYTNVRVLDSLRSTANPENISSFSKSRKFEFIEGDIRDQNLVHNLVGKSDQVIHLAGETHVDKAINDSKLFYEVNVLGTHTLLQASVDNNINKFLQISTDEVWGHSLPGVVFSELSPYAPRNPYSASKAAADHMVRSFGVTYNLPYNIIHFTNLYGPWQYPDKLIPKSILKLIEEQKLQIHGNGENMRMWLHVEDSINGVTAVLKKGVNGESYALGSHDEKTNLEVAETLSELFGQPMTEIEFVADRPGNDLRYCVDFSKIKTELGWEPHILFKDGVKDEISWYKQHGDWLGRRR